MDFTGIRFNGKHSSDFNILRVSDGDRYQDTLVPDFEDYTESVSGGVGTYYYGSEDKQKEFSLNFAFDKMTEKNLREVRQWLGVKKPCDLIFDEWPYKAYSAKISSPPSFETVCFTENGERIYKGEISVNMVCYYPYARGLYRSLEETVEAAGYNVAIKDHEPIYIVRPNLNDVLIIISKATEEKNNLKEGNNYTVNLYFKDKNSNEGYLAFNLNYPNKGQNNGMVISDIAAGGKLTDLNTKEAYFSFNSQFLFFNLNILQLKEKLGQNNVLIDHIQIYNNQDTNDVNDWRSARPESLDNVLINEWISSTGLTDLSLWATESIKNSSINIHNIGDLPTDYTISNQINIDNFIRGEGSYIIYTFAHNNNESKIKISLDNEVASSGYYRKQHFLRQINLVDYNRLDPSCCYVSIPDNMIHPLVSSFSQNCGSLKLKNDSCAYLIIKAINKTPQKHFLNVTCKLSESKTLYLPSTLTPGTIYAVENIEMEKGEYPIELTISCYIGESPASDSALERISFQIFLVCSDPNSTGPVGRLELDSYPNMLYWEDNSDKKTVLNSLITEGELGALELGNTKLAVKTDIKCSSLIEYNYLYY